MTDMIEPAEAHDENEKLRLERTANCPQRNCPQQLDEEMLLRCIRTNRLLCMECAVLTPTGYIAKEVARAHDDKFFKGGTQDYVIAALVCGIGMLVAAGLFKNFVGYFFIALFVAPLIGTGLTEAALRLSQRRRGRYSDVIGAAATAIGGFVGSMLVVYSQVADFNAQLLSSIPESMRDDYSDQLLEPLSVALESTFTDLGVLIFVVVATITVYARFKVRI